MRSIRDTKRYKVVAMVSVDAMNIEEAEELVGMMIVDPDYADDYDPSVVNGLVPLAVVEVPNENR